MADYGDGGGVMRVLKAICVAFMLVFSVRFLSMGILASAEIEGHTAATSTSSGNYAAMHTSSGNHAATSTSSGNNKHTTLLGRKKHSVPVKLNPTYSSKRRVPSGPDPIHNRYCFLL
uniref:Uncharacterized protein n=1 Tax=Chenopodium quinoa TaxID=63459 RepID=A0A803LSY3_CHEQI